MSLRAGTKRACDRQPNVHEYRCERRAHTSVPELRASAAKLGW